MSETAAASPSDIQKCIDGLKALSPFYLYHKWLGKKYPSTAHGQTGAIVPTKGLPCVTSVAVCFHSGATVVQPVVGSVLHVDDDHQALLGSLAFVTSGPYHTECKVPIYMAFFPYAKMGLQLPLSITGSYQAYTDVHVN
jgi:hypothetical protein